MMKLMESRQRASREQFNMLLDFMESHGDLSRPQTGLQGRVRTERLWQELTVLLNSVGGSGVNKTSEKWKRVWSDWKTKTKKKATVINRNMRSTGGDPTRGKPFNPLEERILRIIGVASSTGHQDVLEAGMEVSSVSQTQTEPSRDSPIIDEVQLGTTPAPVCIPVHTSVSNPVTPPPPVPAPSNRTTQDRSPTSPTTPRHRLAIRKRRFRQTQLDRVTSRFVSIEEKMLQLKHARDAERSRIDSERLRIEAERVEVERERVRVDAERVRVEEARSRIEASQLEIQRLQLEATQQLASIVTALLSQMASFNNSNQ